MCQIIKSYQICSPTRYIFRNRPYTNCIKSWKIYLILLLDFHIYICSIIEQLISEHLTTIPIHIIQFDYKGLFP